MVSRIIAVSSGKGGVGKSVIASTLALELVKRDYAVGLFDLDFTSPSTHIILGIGKETPTEDKGIVPPLVNDIKYMSLIYYSRSLPTPLRGADNSNALIELLAVTRWEKLDYLILDMPPGIGDVTLDLARLVKRAEFVIVTTPSALAFETAGKLVRLLRTQRMYVSGIVENMRMNHQMTLKEKVCELGVDFLGSVPWDSSLESALGKPSSILRTEIGRSIRGIANQLIQN